MNCLAIFSVRPIGTPSSVLLALTIMVSWLLWTIFIITFCLLLSTHSLKPATPMYIQVLSVGRCRCTRSSLSGSLSIRGRTGAEGSVEVDAIQNSPIVDSVYRFEWEGDTERVGEGVWPRPTSDTQRNVPLHRHTNLRHLRLLFVFDSDYFSISGEYDCHSRRHYPPWCLP